MQVCPVSTVFIHMYYIHMYVCGRPISLSAIILPAQWTFHYLSKLTTCTPFFSPSGPPCFSTPLLPYAPRAARDCPEGHILFLLSSYSAYANPCSGYIIMQPKYLHPALDFAVCVVSRAYIIHMYMESGHGRGDEYCTMYL